ncbi:hypothetical protein [Roseburia sp. 499]|uniref:hypothetical protein n=1 Tax=Roseburia sp. 499 TaxID=1261634 RepID=UPI002ED64B2E|nr:hypothetical protein BIV20_13865 [Roseburia sp. 499]
MKRKLLTIMLSVALLFTGTTIPTHAAEGGRTVPHYDITKVGGNWDGTHYTLPDGTLVTDAFFFDGAYTYYLQADGTPMKDKLTYHPDGEHIIYLDSYGHEVFTNFQYCPSVGYTCYFDSNGYLYKDQITFVGDNVYYLNANGAMEQNGWFQFANGADYGYANWNGTLMNNGFSYDPWGRIVFYHWNGMVARGLITDGVTYYNMDTTDGHLTGSFIMPTTPTPAPAQPTHNHQWQPHWATRVVQEAYDETVTKTVTEWELHCFSNEDPSWDITAEWQANRPDLPNEGAYMSVMGYGCSCHTDTVPVEKQVTETVHHPAVTEQYIDYYFCADDSCGERHTPAELGKPDK